MPRTSRRVSGIPIDPRRRTRVFSVCTVCQFSNNVASNCAGTPCGGAAAPPPPDAGVGEQCPQGTMLAGRANYADCGRVGRVPHQTLPPDPALVAYDDLAHTCGAPVPVIRVMGVHTTRISSVPSC